MLAAGSAERAIFDHLMMDRDIRKMFSPTGLEDIICKILSVNKTNIIRTPNISNPNRYVS